MYEGKNATKLHHIFSKSINKKRTDTAADRREVPFDLIVQPEVLEDIDGDIHDLIDTELKQCCGEEGVIITDMQKILRQVAELMQCLRLVEKQKQELKIEVVQLREQLQDKDAQVRDLGSRIATLDRDMREKDMEQDRLRDKCQREIEQAKKNRVMFFREICIYKTDIFRLQSGQADAHGRGGGPEREQKQSPRSRDGKDAATRRESGQPAVPDAPNFDVDFGGDNSGETQAAVDDAVRAARQEMDEKYAAKRAREREEYSAKEEKMKIKIQEALEEAEHQRKEKKKLEMELVEKSRELRKLKAQQSNDQDGDT